MITTDPAVMGGQHCIRGLRITVATIAGLVADGVPVARILEAYPLLSAEDVAEAVQFMHRNP